MATLTAPDGRKYKTNSQAEVTRLVAQGYKVAKPRTAPKPDDSGTSSK